jgi:NhaA family Na+:H+ antiporter
MANTKVYVLCVALITAAVLAIGGVLWSMEPPPLVLEPPAEAPEPEWRRGATDAEITIDVYPDFDCPGCIETEGVVLEVLDFYPRYAEMVYHHYPLSEWGQLCAEALEAAGEQGKFWEFHDKLLLGLQHDIAGLKVCAEEVGLDVQAFGEALDSRKFMAKVVVAKEEAILQGVEHATIFVNGREYHKYPPQVGDISAMIAEELEKIRQEAGQ